MHVIRSRNRLRHENASGRAFQFPQCPPKAELRSGDDEFFWCHHSCLPFLYIELTHESRPTVVLCVVLGGDRQDAGGHSQLFWRRQTAAGEPEPEHASEKGCGMDLFASFRSPLPSFSSIVIAIVFYRPHRCSHYIMVANRRIHFYRVAKSARSKPEALAG